MTEDLYFVTINNHTVAENMPMDLVGVFIEAIFRKYYNEKEIVVSVERMDNERN